MSAFIRTRKLFAQTHITRGLHDGKVSEGKLIKIYASLCPTDIRTHTHTCTPHTHMHTHTTLTIISYLPLPTWQTICFHIPSSLLRTLGVLNTRFIIAHIFKDFRGSKQFQASEYLVSAPPQYNTWFFAYNPIFFPSIPACIFWVTYEWFSACGLQPLWGFHSRYLYYN